MIKRGPHLQGPLSGPMRAALYNARKHRLARMGGGGAPAPAGYTQWRVFLLTNGGSDHFSVPEVEFMTASGGADVTTSADAAANAIFSSEASSYNAAAKAFDNLVGTVWSTPDGNSSNEWIGWDFGEVTDIVEFTLTSYNNATAPQTFQLQASADGTTWDDIGSEFTSTGWGSYETRTFTI